MNRWWVVCWIQDSRWKKEERIEGRGRGLEWRERKRWWKLAGSEGLEERDLKGLRRMAQCTVNVKKSRRDRLFSSCSVYRCIYLPILNLFTNLQSVDLSISSSIFECIHVFYRQMYGKRGKVERSRTRRKKKRNEWWKRVDMSVRRNLDERTEKEVLREREREAEREGLSVDVVAFYAFFLSRKAFYLWVFWRGTSLDRSFHRVVEGGRWMECTYTPSRCFPLIDHLKRSINFLYRQAHLSLRK